MEENTKMSEVVSEIKGASEEELRDVIEKWFESTRTQGMHIGAQFISAAVYGAIEKNLKKGSQSSLRDYQRAVKRVIEIVSMKLKQQETQQNDSEEVNDSTKEGDPQW
jgi:anti-anti-sigma regulatory factor